MNLKKNAVVNRAGKLSADPSKKELADFVRTTVAEQVAASLSEYDRKKKKAQSCPLGHLLRLLLIGGLIAVIHYFFPFFSDVDSEENDEDDGENEEQEISVK